VATYSALTTSLWPFLGTYTPRVSSRIEQRLGLITQPHQQRIERRSLLPWPQLNHLTNGFVQQSDRRGILRHLIKLPWPISVIAHSPFYQIRAKCVSRSRESRNVLQMRFYGGRNLAKAERDLVLATLKLCSNNRTQTAKMLGMARSTLDKKLKQYAASGVPVPPAQNGGFRERAAASLGRASG
jgi:hypothetical protein